MYLFLLHVNSFKTLTIFRLTLKDVYEKSHANKRVSLCII